jgi:hypothetical protein
MKDSLTPSPMAESVLGLMIDRDDVQQTILEETLNSQQNGNILESGRTLCSSQSEIKGPLSRYPRAVDLQQCPVSGGGGAWHTHVTPQQLLNPENSLPDIGSVVFGQLDVIGVVGAESAEYVMAADDQDAAISEFRDALGADIAEQGELVSAIESGRVNPITARSRVKKRMAGLFTQKKTGYSGLAEQVRSGSGVVAASVQSYDKIEVAMLNHTEPETVDYAEAMASPQSCMRLTGAMGENAERTLRDVIPESVRSTAVGAAVGTVVGNLVNSLVFGE